MYKKVFFYLLFVILSLNPVYPQINTLEPIKKEDRVLILAPHPDDETIGCAGIIQQALKVGAQVNVAYLTNGDHNEFAFIVYEKRLPLRKTEFIHLGEVRRREAIRAMKILGLNENNLIFLGYPDSGTFAIFSQYWQTAKPFRTLLTRISTVPYRTNPSFGAPYRGESILNDLKKVFMNYKPNKIFVSHPADTNVDHKAAYLFLQIVLRDLVRVIPEPKIYPFLIHCAGWPLPRYYHPGLSLEPPKQFSNSQINWFKFELTPEQLNKKHQAILCYKSQTESSAFYLLSFARKNELFGDYPEIELKKQSSLKEQAVSFFGFSNMFSSSDIGILSGLENLVEDKGQVSYAALDDSLVIRIEKPKELIRRAIVIVYLFGYSHKKPFAQMPKIRIITKYDKFKVFDARKIIKAEGISLELCPNALILRVPLQILGDPDFVLTSVRAHGRALSPDATGFRKIYIKN